MEGPQHGEVHWYRGGRGGGVARARMAGTCCSSAGFPMIQYSSEGLSQEHQSLFSRSKMSVCLRCLSASIVFKVSKCCTFRSIKYICMGVDSSRQSMLLAMWNSDNAMWSIELAGSRERLYPVMHVAGEWIHRPVATSQSGHSFQVRTIERYS